MRGFTGELTDPTTGFVHLRARDYNTATGRFTSMDTVQPNAPGTQGYNRCAYVANNPATWTDPSGHSTAACAHLLDKGLLGVSALAYGWAVGKSSRAAYYIQIMASYNLKGSLAAAAIDLMPSPLDAIGATVVATTSLVVGKLMIWMLWAGDAHVSKPAAFALLLAGVLLLLVGAILQQMTALVTWWTAMPEQICKRIGFDDQPSSRGSQTPDGQDRSAMWSAPSNVPYLPTAPRPKAARAR